MKIIEVQNKTDRKKFVNFQFDLYKNSKFWVPPIIDDEIKAITPEKNPAFDFCEAKFFIVIDNNKVVGRVGAIINNLYNKKTGKKLIRFSRLEFIDNIEISSTLIKKVIDFGKEKGMEIIHGPLGFTNLDTQGMLIEGFEHLPSIASVYHMPYYKTHLEKLGFGKENDWLEFRLTIGENAVQKAMRGSSLVQRRYGFTVKSFTKTDELKPYTKKIFEILNDAFQVLPYVVPFNEKMIDIYADKYFKILNPKFIKLIEKDENIIGFVIGMPSLSEAMQKANGKLYPFGFTHILKALKNPNVIDMLLTGVLQKYQNTGAAVILMAELQNQMIKDGIDTIETTGIFESNKNAISNWKSYEHIQHKRRRCFIKEIN